jgi:hypothetical protein
VAAVSVAVQVEKRRGRVEERSLEATALLNDYLDWPGVGQAFRIRRRRVVAGKESVETAWGITSLPPAKAGAGRLLALARGHWRIENCLHWVRDVVLREDECRVRHRTIAQNLTAMRNAVVRLLRRHGVRPLVAAVERFAARRDEAIGCVLARIK